MMGNDAGDCCVVLLMTFDNVGDCCVEELIAWGDVGGRGAMMTEDDEAEMVCVRFRTIDAGSSTRGTSPVRSHTTSSSSAPSSAFAI